MKTKNLRSTIFPSLIILCGFLGQAQTPYFYCGGSITDLNNWNDASDCSGLPPADFVQTGDTWNIISNASLDNDWSLGDGAIVNIGDGVAAVTLNTAGFNIIGGPGGNSTTNVLASSKFTIATINFLAAGNNNGLVASIAGCTVEYNIAGETVKALTYSNLTITLSATLGGGIVNVNGTLTITSPSILTMASGKLTIGTAGSFAGTGTLSGDATASLTYSSSSSSTFFMDQTTPGTTNRMKTVSKGTNASTLTLGNALEIVPLGVIKSTKGTLALGAGLLTLEATQSTAGSIGNCTGGSITGTINSQVFHNPTGNKTDWTTMGSAGLTDATFLMWENSFPITCPSCVQTQAGGSPFTSVYSYDETLTGGGDFSNAAHYVDLTGDGATINNGQGYWVYMGNSSPGTATAGEVITVTGTPQKGTISSPTIHFTNGTNGYNLFANPYPAPINWASVTAEPTNVGKMDNSCYMYNAADGSYETFNSTGIASGSYAGFKNKCIPAGMAFYVLAVLGGNGTTLTFKETMKLAPSSTNQNDLLRGSTENSVETLNNDTNNFTYFRLQTFGTGMMSETVIGFDNRSSIGRDYFFDALFLAGTQPLKVTTVMGGYEFAINGVPDLNQNYSIPVKMITTTTGTYTITATDFQNMPIGPCLMLHDNYTSSDYDLRQGSFSLTLNDTETVARFVLNVTVNPLVITTNTIQESCVNSNNGYITAVGNNAGPWDYVWKNASDSIVRMSLGKTVSDTLLGLNVGVYSVEVHSTGSCDDAVQTFTLTAPAATTSAFTVSQSTVNAGSNVTFTDNSTNANSYWWTFGDGNTSNLQNPVYAYGIAGIYTVTFYAINSTCGDTVTSTQTITVQGSTGIANSITNDIVLSKDQNGAFVKFNFSGQTKVSITVYNSLGQVLLSNANLAVVNDKIYLNIDNAKDQLIFVSIGNLDKNTQITKKLYNN